METNNFDRIAHYYDTASYVVFGNALKKSQLHFIDQIPSQATVLIVGDGNGWFLYNLLKKKQYQKIVSVEPSLAMTQLAQKRIASLAYQAKVTFITHTIEDALLHEQFDVIVTSYFLDLFEESHLKKIMKQLSSLMNSEGIWISTDFKINRTSFHSYWQIPLVKIMYVFFKIVSHLQTSTLLSFTTYFNALGLKMNRSKVYYGGMIQTAIYTK